MTRIESVDWRRASRLEDRASDRGRRPTGLASLGARFV